MQLKFLFLMILIKVQFPTEQIYYRFYFEQVV